MADKNYQVKIDFTLGSQSKQKLEAEINDIKTKAAEKAVQQGGLTDPKVAAALMTEYDNIEKEINHLGDTQKKVWEAGTEANKKYQKSIGDSTQGIDALYEQVLKLNRAIEDTRPVTDDLLARAEQFEATGQMLNKSAIQLEKFSRIALVGGTAIVGGAFAAASKYVSEATEATEVTIAWKNAQEDMEKSSKRISAVLAKEMLPFLKQGAELIQKAADFIEKNPSVIPAAIRVGEILIGIGVIGKAVSTGIRLVSDAATIQAAYLKAQAARIEEAAATKALIAAEQQMLAADKQLVASGSKGVGGGTVSTAAKGGLAAAAVDVVVLLGSFAAGLLAADKAFDAIQKHDVTFQDYVTTLKQTLAIDAKNFGDWLEGIGIRTPGGGKRLLFQQDTGEQMFRSVAEALGLLEKKAKDAAAAVNSIDLGSVANSPAKEQILNAYEDYLSDVKDMEQKFQSDRRKISEDALHDELESNKKYASSVAKVNADLANSLSKLASDFAKANADAERNYNEERAKILSEQVEDIANVRSDLRDRLEKMERDSQERQSELIAQRDALGLAKEQRRLRNEKQEASREATKEIAERRADAAKRLEELKTSFEQERAERLTEYQSRVAEVRRQAAERLEELRAEHQEELIRIRAQRAEKIRELDAAFRAERDRRVQYFLAQIRDLDATLLGEKNLRDQRQAEMIADLDRWFATYRSHWQAGLNSLANSTPTSDTGGYVHKGLYRMAWDGNKEFVLSGPTTRAAERVLGTQLSQENIMKLLSSGNNTQTNYYDQRRMEIPLTKDQKKLYREAAIEALKEVIGA